MNRTEMARQSTEQRNAQRLSSESASRMDLLLEGQLDRVEAATRELAPIIEAVRVISQEAQDTLRGFKQATEDTRRCLDQAREAANAIERRSQRLTYKLWAGMVLVCLAGAAVSVSSYSLWQHFFGEDRAGVTTWQGQSSGHSRSIPANKK